MLGIMMVQKIQTSHKNYGIQSIESKLMEENGLSRTEAQKFTDLELAASLGWNIYSQNFRNQLKDISSFINIKDSNGDTLLHRVFTQQPDNIIGIIKLLLDAGANINAQNNNGDTILHMAMRNYNKQEQTSPKNLKMIEFLLDPEATAADINLRNKYGASPHNMNPDLIMDIVAKQHKIKHENAKKEHNARLARLETLKEEKDNYRKNSYTR